MSEALDPDVGASSGFRRRLRRVAVDTRPLAIPAFRRTFLGQGTAFVGTMVTSVAAPVQIYAISHSSLQVGFAGLVGLIPMIVFGLYGGAVADAVDRRVLYLSSSSLTWVVTLALLAQSLLGLRSVALILVLIGVQTAAFAVSSSTRGAVVPALVPVELVSAANALNFTAGNVGSVLGPLIAGVLVGLDHGFAYAYGLDALLFTAALYSAFRLPALRPPTTAGRPGLRSVLDGLLFIGANPVLLMSFVVDIAAMVLAMPRALFPQAAATRFHGGVGLLYSSIAAGSVLAGLSSGWIGRVRRQAVVLTAAVVGWAVAIALAGLAHAYWLAVVLLAVGGAADLVSAVCRQTILQTYVPDGMRGRLQGVFTVVVAGGPRLGDLRAGAMASATTLTVAWTGSALLCVVVVVVAAVAVRPFWRYDTSQPHHVALGSGSVPLPASRDGELPEGADLAT
jgi:MFS family permease